MALSSLSSATSSGQISYTWTVSCEGANFSRRKGLMRLLDWHCFALLMVKAGLDFDANAGEVPVPKLTTS